MNWLRHRPKIFDFLHAEMNTKLQTERERETDRQRDRQMNRVAVRERESKGVNLTTECAW
jgi:hypothetical protein